ncbi:hypothetical protein LJB76_02605 [Clostridia bacterium OttesenSCG-928-O13]|nr:hypothetical protein [Clostridia bacterium OttesenSCG-928-O13]
MKAATALIFFLLMCLLADASWIFPLFGLMACATVYVTSKRKKPADADTSGEAMDG